METHAQQETGVLCIGKDTLLQKSINTLLDNKKVTWCEWSDLKQKDTSSKDVVLVLDTDTDTEMEKLLHFQGSIYFINCNNSCFHLLPQFDIGDFFAVNNYTDYKLFRDRYPLSNTIFIPDITLCIPIQPRMSQECKMIGICCNTIEYIDIIVAIIVQNTHYKYCFIPTKETSALFNDCDYIIGDSYKSVILSILYLKPFLCIYQGDTDRGVMSGISNWFIGLDTTSVNPLKAKQKLVYNTLEQTTTNYTNSVQKLVDVKKDYITQLDSFKQTLNEIIESPIKRLEPPSFLSDKMNKDLLQNILNNVLDGNTRTIDKVYKGIPLQNILQGSKQNDATRQKITENILWEITGDPYFDVYWSDLYEKIFSENLVTQVSRIIKDYHTNWKWSGNGITTVINKMNQDMYRNGWGFLSTVKLKGVDLLDVHVDKTFGKGDTFYKSKGIIPYTKPWIGFIHNELIIQKQSFLDSLPFCKCLIVFDKFLQYDLDTKLTKLKTKTKVPLVTMTHPTDTNIIPFTWSGFLSNKKRAIIQVHPGYSIYKIVLPKTSIITRKCILGKNGTEMTLPEIPENLPTDMYSVLLENQKSVEMLQEMPNHQYDLLLSEGVVFLDTNCYKQGYDISTVIECIVRNTPIIVNKKDTILEYLGEDYPLYYTDFYEASKLLDDTDKIKQAYLYLLQLDKNEYNVNIFTRSLESVLSTF